MLIHYVAAPPSILLGYPPPPPPKKSAVSDNLEANDIFPDTVSLCGISFVHPTNLFIEVAVFPFWATLSALLMATCF